MAVHCRQTRGGGQYIDVGLVDVDGGSDTVGRVQGSGDHQTRSRPSCAGREAPAVRAVVDGVYGGGEGEDSRSILASTTSKSPLENHLVKLGSDIGFFTDAERGSRGGRFWRGVGPEHRPRHRKRRRLRAGRADAGRLPVSRSVGSFVSSKSIGPRIAAVSGPVSRLPDRVFRSTNGHGRCGEWRTCLVDFLEHPAFVHELS